jgi:hypothetical protein
MTPTHFKDACRHLRARAPEEWHEFVLMFNEYTAEAVDAVSEADAASIMERKGFALSCKGILQAFNSLDKPASAQPSVPMPFGP